MPVRHIAIRTDATRQIGTGHFMRCLTLADALKHSGAQIRFISRDLPSHLREMLAAKGMELVPLESGFGASAFDDLAHSHWLGTNQASDAQATIRALSGRSWDWLVVDHYALDARWETALRSTAKRILVIDDLADRQHDCDVLLDQNYYENQEVRYDGLLPSKCTTLLGVNYLLLRPEFADARKRIKSRDGTIRRILVFFGGVDSANQTQKTLNAFRLLSQPNDIVVDVVVGADNPVRYEIQGLCNQLPNANFHCQISNMAELILGADIGIGAGGVAMWERAYLGLPTITIVIAANQVRTTEDFAKTGAIEYLGRAEHLSSEDYTRAIIRLMREPLRVKQMGDVALRLLHSTGSSLNNVVQYLVANQTHQSGR